MFDEKTKIALKEGDPVAFREVFRLLYPRMKGYCRLFIANRDQADDIIQEIFITLWEKRDTIKTEKSIESFLFTILRNRCLNYLKQKRLEVDRIDMDNIHIAELQYLYQLDFTQKEEMSLEERLVQLFQQAVEELPEKMKIAFVKSKIEGRKQQEVADELGISLKMVEKNISRAKEIIRARLIKKLPALVGLIPVFL